uniref:Uncharacterized protein n=1 Tax=Picea sitchensis TaxID=3332 RepID=D5A8V2_PICSI|nr:unknown [Picea sitchensis]
MMDLPKMNDQTRFQSWEMKMNYRHLRLPKMYRVIEHLGGFRKPCYMFYLAYLL